MSEQISILNGAFTATLEKGKNGKQTWQYTPNLKKIGAKPSHKGHEREKPQFFFIERAEKEYVAKYQSTLKQMALNIVKYLKQL